MDAGMNLEAALGERSAWIARAGARWSALVHASALGFVAMLYANPMYWWPELEQLRLAAAAMALSAVALVAHRIVSGERVRLGLPQAGPLLAYLAFVPLSFAWTLSEDATTRATVDAAKLAVVFVIVQAAVDAPSRLRRFVLAAGLAALGPALGTLWVWSGGEPLVDGFRAHWRGLFGDPNWLAGSLVAVLPFAILGAFAARSVLARVLFAATAVLQVAAIVGTHSRSGAVGAALAIGLAVLRGTTMGPLRKAGLALATVAALVAFAPDSFWQRSRSIAEYDQDASVEGREHAWSVLRVILEERPLTGVGAGAFLPSWDRYAPLDAGGHRYVVHNLFFEIVGELGLVAFGLFLAFCAWLLRAVWRAGDDPLVGAEARAVFAGLLGYLVVEMVNGYSASWFLYVLFACGVGVVRLARARASVARASVMSEPAG
ncbi:MAG: O-antigen ligase family protein [Anaeromyxobacteraceae bacterium]